MSVLIFYCSPLQLNPLGLGKYVKLSDYRKYHKNKEAWISAPTDRLGKISMFSQVTNADILSASNVYELELRSGMSEMVQS